MITAANASCIFHCDAQVAHAVAHTDYSNTPLGQGGLELVGGLDRVCVRMCLVWHHFVVTLR